MVQSNSETKQGIFIILTECVETMKKCAKIRTLYDFTSSG